MLTPVPTSRLGPALVQGKDGAIYAIGGQAFAGIGPGWQYLNTVEAYNPGTNTWETITPTPTAHSQHAAVSGQDGRIFAISGYLFRTGSMEAFHLFSTFLFLLYYLRYLYKVCIKIYKYLHSFFNYTTYLLCLLW